MRISRVDAQGHVVITDALNTGRGDYGVYNGDTGIATLIGNVVIQRGVNVIQGQRGVMDLNNNIARMMPGGGSGDGKQRVQGLFVRDQAKPGARAGRRPQAPMMRNAWMRRPEMPDPASGSAARCRSDLAAAAAATGGG